METRDEIDSDEDSFSDETLECPICSGTDGCDCSKQPYCNETLGCPIYEVRKVDEEAEEEEGDPKEGIHSAPNKVIPYIVDGMRAELRVTMVADYFANDFDAKATSERIFHSLSEILRKTPGLRNGKERRDLQRWGKYTVRSEMDGRYAPLSPGKMRAGWEAAGAEARDMGSTLHAIVEHFLKGEGFPDNWQQSPFAQEINNFRKWMRQWNVKPMAESNRVNPLADNTDHWIAVASELPVGGTISLYMDNCTRVIFAGTIDCLFYNPARDQYMLVDIKRAKRSGWYRANPCPPPLQMHRRTKKTYYAVQCNTYAEALRLQYGIDVGPRMYILRLRENESEFIKVECFPPGFDGRLVVACCRQKREGREEEEEEEEERKFS